MTTAKKLRDLVDDLGEDAPAEALQRYRALYEAVNEETRFAFLIQTHFNAGLLARTRPYSSSIVPINEASLVQNGG